MNLMSSVIMSKISGSGSGGGGGEDKYVHVAGTTPTIAAQKGTTYICDDTITALTLSSLPSEGGVHIVFAAGSTAPQITAPAYVVYREDDEITKNKINEVDIMCYQIGTDRYALGLICAFDAPT